MDIIGFWIEILRGWITKVLYSLCDFLFLSLAEILQVLKSSAVAIVLGFREKEMF